MPKPDGLKEELSYFKFFFGVVVATFITLVGWMATNYDKAELWLVILAVIFSFVFAISAFFINKKTRKLIKQIYKASKE
ncbi:MULTISPECIES: hypothetical protein [Helicobacter]|uniref:Uncharacterized protein n=1 Tax=Helicobacter bilis ATCC 43879 TaxID=613026 RepID=C3XJ75_9HELI|nr:MULTISPECIES: hypothetical protein [Helicobacter]EEO25064.1 hypothetical protein HRAG_02121 [Helicobacter bilis ATCC 43879]